MKIKIISTPENSGIIHIDELKSGGWIKKAIKHPGRCTPGSPNYDCPKGSPQWNLAQRFKHGDLHKHEDGGNIFADGGEPTIDDRINYTTANYNKAWDALKLERKKSIGGRDLIKYKKLVKEEEKNLNELQKIKINSIPDNLILTGKETPEELQKIANDRKAKADYKYSTGNNKQARQEEKYVEQINNILSSKPQTNLIPINNTPTPLFTNNQVVTPIQNQFTTTKPVTSTVTPVIVPINNRTTPVTSTTNTTPIIPSSGKDNISPEDYGNLKEIYAKAQQSKNPKDILAFQKEFHRVAPNTAKSILINSPLTAKGIREKVDPNDPNIQHYLSQNEDEFWGKRTEQYGLALDDLAKGQTSVAKPITTSETDTPVPIDDSKSSYNFGNVTPAKKPLFNAKGFDYTQIMPELYGLIADPTLKTWTQKFEPILNKSYNTNIQAELNANQADAYYGINSLGNNNATRSANIGNILGQKYIANNNIYNQKYNVDLQNRVQTDNQNNALMNQANVDNYGRAKNQFDERVQGEENQFLRKHSIFSSLANKEAEYQRDKQTKNFWFDILSKNFTTDKDGRLVLDPNTPTPIVGSTVSTPTSKPADVTRITTASDNKGKVTQKKTETYKK